MGEETGERPTQISNLEAMIKEELNDDHSRLEERVEETKAPIKEIDLIMSEEGSMKYS